MLVPISKKRISQVSRWLLDQILAHGKLKVVAGLGRQFVYLQLLSPSHPMALSSLFWTRCGISSLNFSALQLNFVRFDTHSPSLVLLQTSSQTHHVNVFTGLNECLSTHQSATLKATFVEVCRGGGCSPFKILLMHLQLRVPFSLPREWRRLQ